MSLPQLKPHPAQPGGTADARRRWLVASGAAAAVAFAGTLVGCGFALRQTPPLPFARLNLVGATERSPLVNELRQRLQEAGVAVDAPRPAADAAVAPATAVVLHVLEDKREKRVVASTSAGQVRELQLRSTFQFRLATPSGGELIGPTTLMLTRDLSYSEAFALSKLQEEAELYAAMQSDIVQQVLRRLARAPVGG